MLYWVSQNCCHPRADVQLNRKRGRMPNLAILPRCYCYLHMINALSMNRTWSITQQNTSSQISMPIEAVHLRTIWSDENPRCDSQVQWVHYNHGVTLELADLGEMNATTWASIYFLGVVYEALTHLLICVCRVLVGWLTVYMSDVFWVGHRKHNANRQLLL